MTETMTKSQVVGLYSFPKSGNTWLRAIIAGATGMPMGPGVLQKYVTDTHYGKVMENPWQFQGRDWYFYKSHHKEMLQTDKDGSPLHTDKVVYIYRHPLDVFMSYLNFVSGNVSPQAGKGLPFNYDSVEDLTPEQLEQLFAIYLEHATITPKNRAFGGMFEHVENFRKLQAGGMPVHILRYEDLYGDFEGIVAGLMDFLGLQDIDIENVYRAADRRTKQNGKFFWKRQADNYRNYLTEDQIHRFKTRWRDQMLSLGYDAD